MSIQASIHLSIHLFIHPSFHLSIDPLNTPEKMLSMLFDLSMTGQNIKNQDILEIPEQTVAVVGRTMASKITIFCSLKPEIMLGYLEREN